MAKKIPVPKIKSKKMHWLDKLFMGIGGLSPFTGRGALHQSMTSQTAAGRAAQAAQMAKLAKYGNVASKAARYSGLMNPWTAVPFAGTYLAKHLVGNALESYKNPDVGQGSSGPLWLFDNRGISEEGNERLLQERLAREELMFARNAARQNRRDGGLAGLL